MKGCKGCRVYLSYSNQNSVTFDIDYSSSSVYGVRPYKYSYSYGKYMTYWGDYDRLFPNRGNTLGVYLDFYEEVASFVTIGTITWYSSDSEPAPLPFNKSHKEEFTPTA